MKILLSFAFTIIFVLNAYTQHHIEGTLGGLQHQNVSLLEYFGDKHQFVDSTRSDGNGWFSFSLDAEAPAGLYSLAIGKNPLFNFIYKGEDITLKYEPGEYSLPEFIFSIENLIYFDYLVQSDKYAQKSGMMLDLLQYYPEKDSFYLAAESHFHALQLEFRAYTDRIINEYPTTLAAHMVNSDRPIVIPRGFDWEDLLEFNRSHFLDETDFSDTLLLNTNILTGKAIDYMGFYSSSNMNRDVQEQFFIQAVDTILHKAMENGKIYDFLMAYLIEGFDMYGFDKVISHIAENYEPAETCVNEDRKSELQKRIENLRRLAVGNKAPNIEITDVNGNIFSIQDSEHEYILLVFWASWCPHCEVMIPEIKSLYEDESLIKFEVLSLSIDTSKADYSAAIAQQASAWINYCDFKGWDTRTAIDYSIYATPTMFLIDRSRNIIARPVNAYDLRRELGKLGN